jgi:hypothetical protein
VPIKETTTILATPPRPQPRALYQFELLIGLACVARPALKQTPEAVPTPIAPGRIESDGRSGRGKGRLLAVRGMECTDSLKVMLRSSD